MPRYPIPKQRTRVEIKVSNSRFIASIAPAATMAEAQAFLREIRAEMPDATHHVHAFKIGYGASVSEALSDDGEPAGTAGPPALAVLRGAQIGDAALVITRYFGGTKLGTGGLVAAYSQAAKAALAAVERVERIARDRFEISVPYALHKPLRRLLTGSECIIEMEQFEADVRLRFLAPRDRIADLTAQIEQLSAGRVRPTSVSDSDPRT